MAMETALDRIRPYQEALRCVVCHGPLRFVESGLCCEKCGEIFSVHDGVPYLVDPKDTGGQALAGHMEALFRFPAFYRFKIRLLLKLNRTNDLNLTEYLNGQRVLDVGCGPFIYGYDATLAHSIMGMDLSPQFAHAMANHDPRNLYIVANAKRIPCADRSFDVSFLRYVIHHIPGDTAELLAEVARVTRNYLIIFDHVRSDVPWQRNIQSTYWQMFDSGHHYNLRSEWDHLLQPYRVATFHQTGRMFGNICQIVVDLRERR